MTLSKSSSSERAPDSADAPNCQTGPTLFRQATISNSRGLHARAAAKFVKLAESFSAEIVVSNRGQDVSGRSIMGLMILAASSGTTIEMRAAGKDAAAALDALEQLINNHFHEE